MRVKLSNEGLRHFGDGRRNPNREGVILGEAYKGVAWRVQWDGNTAGSPINKRFVTIIPDETN
jgi:hypothetical protein